MGHRRLSDDQYECSADLQPRFKHIDKMNVKNFTDNVKNMFYRKK